MHSLISWTQNGPVKLTGHKQEKELIPSIHVPPLKQELRRKQREQHQLWRLVPLTCHLESQAAGIPAVTQATTPEHPQYLHPADFTFFQTRLVANWPWVPAAFLQPSSLEEYLKGLSLLEIPRESEAFQILLSPSAVSHVFYISFSLSQCIRKVQNR